LDYQKPYILASSADENPGSKAFVGKKQYQAVPKKDGLIRVIDSEKID
jgi:hypothetical protein